MPGLLGDSRKKGAGYYGLLERPDGGYSTELSIGVDWGRGEQEIPTLVPGLSEYEMQYLLTTDPQQIFQRNPDVFQAIQRKAIEHAEQRMRAGQSPFYD